MSGSLRAILRPQRLVLRSGPQGPAGDTGGAGVTSVNGDEGPDVTLDAADVGADPAGTAAGLVAALGNSSTRNVGTTAGTVAAGDDSRLTDARTPTAHASTHATGQSDALSPGAIGAVPAGAWGSSGLTFSGSSADKAGAIASWRIDGDNAPRLLLGTAGESLIWRDTPDPGWYAEALTVADITDAVSTADTTATPTASKIPIADGAGKLDGWITAASTSAPGIVELADTTEITTGRAVQPDHKRLVGESTTITSGSSNYAIPAWATHLTVGLLAPGGGGGSGRRGATATVRGGGQGAGGGGSIFVTLPVAFFGGAGANVAYSIGAAGSGGAAQTSNDSDGNPGTAGGDVTFGNLTAKGGRGGAGGTALAQLTTVAYGGQGGGQGGWHAGTATTFTDGYPATGGGGGGGGVGGTIGAGNTAGLGGAGGTGGSGAAGGGGGNTTPTAGTAGTAPPADVALGGGGGGGGGSIATGAPSAAGAAGALGAGGGGGGGSINGQASGAGAAGGAGRIVVVAH